MINHSFNLENCLDLSLCWVVCFSIQVVALRAIGWHSPSSFFTDHCYQRGIIMKNPVFLATILLTLTLLVTGGCSKKIVQAPDPSVRSGSSSSGHDINYPPAAYSEEGLPKEGTLDDAMNNPVAEPETNTAIGGRTSAGLQPIYFHFDQATIPQEMIEFLIQNANSLKENPNLYVVIEGNCDERGAKEYNMALGERRALNTREYLVGLGIHENRMRTVSYGEERPVDMASTEDAWAKNRRVDFVTE